MSSCNACVSGTFYHVASHEIARHLWRNNTQMSSLRAWKFAVRRQSLHASLKLSPFALIHSRILHSNRLRALPALSSWKPGPLLSVVARQSPDSLAFPGRCSTLRNNTAIKQHWTIRAETVIIFRWQLWRITSQPATPSWRQTFGMNSPFFSPEHKKCGEDKPTSHEYTRARDQNWPRLTFLFTRPTRDKLIRASLQVSSLDYTRSVE